MQDAMQINARINTYVKPVQDTTKIVIILLLLYVVHTKKNVTLDFNLIVDKLILALICLVSKPLHNPHSKSLITINDML